MQTLIDALKAITVIDPVGKWNRDTKEHEEVERHPHVFLWKDGDNSRARLSSEDGGYFCDYYGEYRGGYPWIHPEVEAVAKKFGMMIEWYDPSHIAFYPI